MNTGSNISDEKAAQLHRIWQLEADILEAILRDTPPGKMKASMLSQATTFLKDNGIDAEELSTGRYGPSTQGVLDALTSMPRLGDVHSNHADTLERLEDHPSN